MLEREAVVFLRPAERGRWRAAFGQVAQESQEFLAPLCLVLREFGHRRVVPRLGHIRDETGGGGECAEVENVPSRGVHGGKGSRSTSLDRFERSKPNHVIPVIQGVSVSLGKRHQIHEVSVFVQWHDKGIRLVAFEIRIKVGLEIHVVFVIGHDIVR